MEKEALLSVILNDLKEVETLVQTFKGKEHILPAFLKLTLQKIDNIKQEIELLDAFENTQAAPVKPTEQTVIQTITKAPIENIIASKPLVEETHKASSSIEPQPEPAPAVSQAEPLLEMEIPVMKEEKEHPQPAHDNAPIVEEPKNEKKVTPQKEEVPHTQHQSTHEHDTHTHHHHKAAATLGEMLVTDKTSVHDKIHAHSETSNPAITGTHVDDIRKAIGINDRFLFQRELFDNSNTLMNQTIDEINKLNTFAEALSFIKSNFKWDAEDETAASFIAAVRRKF
jgi:hypothetical protein